SGGVDSTLLLRVAVSVLGERALAAVGRSPTYPESELREAIALARDMRARYVIVDTEETSNPLFTDNPPDRCYHCKLELFSKLKRLAGSRGLRWVADGSNCDDLLDTRPGSRAAREMGVVSPLQEAGLTKHEVRELARHLGLRNWSKPSQACLASRFPYGTKITINELTRVARAEHVLRASGFSQVRVRAHGLVARIEVMPGELDKLLSGELRESVVEELKSAGFLYVSIDLEGYRTGSMNEALPRREKAT
ncbi:MAG: ATP-dependent sacrificial sulfur transferase LarE, partial [Candidatus Eisenbacteria bacterium]